MYAFQFMDATWRIARRTNTTEPLPPYGTEAFRLYEGIYSSRADAETAIRSIREGN